MPEPQNRTELFFETGWMLVTAREYPALRQVRLVQRFKSRSDWMSSVAVGEEGLGCSCLGWLRRGKCWHMRFVLRWNLTGSEVGRFLVRLPNEDDALSGRNSWTAWFEDHIAVVPPELGPSGPQVERPRAHARITPPSIRS